MYRGDATEEERAIEAYATKEAKCHIMPLVIDKLATFLDSPSISSQASHIILRVYMQQL